MAQQKTETHSQDLTAQDAIIEVREHEVIVDRRVLDLLAARLRPARACGIVKPGFPVTAADYDDEGRYGE